ncbi:MAG: hypothetical protein ACI9Y7_001418 [Dokdonia sp.]|jgi:hypothetical protein
METEKIYEDIVVAAFTKAKKEYVNNKKYKLSEYISEQIEELSEVRITSKTFASYYEKYIEKRDVRTVPRHENIERLCLFLGYDSYKDYVNENYNEDITTPLPEDTSKNSDIEKKIVTTLWIVAIMIIGLVSYNKLVVNNAPNSCMIWVNDHYEPIDCSGKRGEIELDKETLERMKQLIGLCKGSTFFLPNDEPIVWYDKHHNKLTFFTKEGIHPTNGKTLKPITQYIIDRYASECETNPKKE